MEIEIIGFLFAIGFLSRAIFLKVTYEKNYAVCIQYKTTNIGCVSYLLYEYEIMVQGEKVVYRNWGTAYFLPTKGKRYKVFVNKTNHNKVVGYNQFTVDVSVACIMLCCLVLMILF